MRSSPFELNLAFPPAVRFSKMSHNVAEMLITNKHVRAKLCRLRAPATVNATSAANATDVNRNIVRWPKFTLGDTLISRNAELLLAAGHES